MCDRDTCNTTPEYYPVLTVPIGDGYKSEVVVRLQVCAFCKSKLRLPDVLTDKIWGQLCEMATKRNITLDRDRITLSFCRINSKAGRSLNEMKPN